MNQMGCQGMFMPAAPFSVEPPRAGKMVRQMKKDAAWKPLIRLFRRFLKKEALSKATYQQIHGSPLAEQGLLFAQALDLPAELAAKPKTPLILLMIISSHRITRKKQLVPAARRLLGKHTTEIWARYFEVFNENS